MDLLSALRPECVRAKQYFADKEVALAEIARLAVHHPALCGYQEEAIFDTLAAREALGSTGFTRGIALPHCRVRGFDTFAAGLITAPDGVPFKSLDGRKTRLFVFVIAPEEERFEDHNRILGDIAEIVQNPEAVAALLAETADSGLYACFRKQASALAQRVNQGAAKKVKP